MIEIPRAALTADEIAKEAEFFCFGTNDLIDPSKFMPLEDFKAEVDKYVRMMKESRKAPGVKEIFLPGEIEFKKFDVIKQTGIPVSDALEAELTELSITLGVVPEGTDFASLVRHFNS